MDAVISGTPDLLECGGDGELGREIAEGFHDILFGAFVRSDPSALS